jgi:hypothetical protein
MKRLLRLLAVVTAISIPLLNGCGGETNDAPEGAGMQGMEDPASFMPPEPENPDAATPK